MISITNLKSVTAMTIGDAHITKKCRLSLIFGLFGTGSNSFL